MISAFVIYFFKRDKIAIELSMGAFFSLGIGPCTLFLLKGKKWNWLINLLPFMVITSVSLISYFLLPSFFRSYLVLIHDHILVVSALSCIFYGIYGYLYVIKNELSFINDSIIVTYIVLVFSCAFFFGVAFLEPNQVFDVDYIYMNYCLFFLGVVLANELKNTLGLKRQVEEVSLEFDSDIKSDEFLQFKQEERVSLINDLMVNYSYANTRTVKYLRRSVNQMHFISMNNLTEHISDKSSGSIEDLYCDKTEVLIETEELVSEENIVKDAYEEIVDSEEKIVELGRESIIRQKLFEDLIDTKLYLASNLTLAKLSEILQISKKELSEYFKNSNSLSYRQYLNRLKIEHAVTIIKERNKDTTVEELTVLCGFNTRLSFYRAFVHIYGFPPSALLNE